MADFASEAVLAALRNDWDTAIILNKKLLSRNPKDIETLNRLAYALMEKGDFLKAKRLYQEVLELDHANPIAEKNLAKIMALIKRGKTFLKRAATSLASRQAKTRLNNVVKDDISTIFLEEPGKTKITKLKNLAEPHILSRLKPAMEVTLSIKRHSVFVKSPDRTYIGALPDDITHRLIPFIKGGSQYRAYIKSVEKNAISILIKEIKKGARFKYSPSFVSITSAYPTFIREDAIKEERRPDVSTYEDLEEEPSKESEEGSEG